ncbi:uncharacterized protein LOC131160370 [Malania oleifera]|uniref:uncharacterized protein LOC131160370 n=1 Tax=Malania oleifera TaxID=397392 RepID=UPI0025AEC8ED|nr:uncharacterized protein LOC131160370 [Malania oleifera]XP_057971976.1 uncharacterized protein LOC131160370 [Malania oleifera]XP_057971977.1 uncharacterized protein LOC131160370 [Malania oleifera]XP_057971978.1 uncharacterized protein LOC131160370 [Malania oleifera]
MVSTGNGDVPKKVRDESGADASLNSDNTKDYNSLHISTSKRGLLGDGNPMRGFQLMNLPRKVKFQNFSCTGCLAFPSSEFQLTAGVRDEVPSFVPSSTNKGIREHFSRVLPHKIDWASLRKMGKEWIANPFNIALLLWTSCVAVSGAILFLVMTGMLNGVLPKKSQRDAWFEVNNQILNALFTLICLYQHPKRFHHLVLLCRWQPKDISTLRKLYCKNGTYKPHEWTHMMIVVALLHVNCFAQYALCSLNLGYKRSERPIIGVGICLSVAIATPAIAGVYSIVSPLGQEYDFEMDKEAQDQILTTNAGQPCAMEKRFSFASGNEHRFVENSPVWRGGLLDFWDDISPAYLSLFCGFCVFGWNMERLGLGNMYVHIATFLLFCTAPFWIFNLAAMNIDNETVREALGVTGVVLCVFGLLYGGFWRIQMRKRFNLPANDLFFGKPAVADCAQWLFCCWCSLAQEVRTADFYDIVEDKFYRKQMCENHKPALSPLPREDGIMQPSPSFPLWNSPNLPTLRTENSPTPTSFSRDYVSPERQYSFLQVECPKGNMYDNSMEPPVPSLIQRAGDAN